MMQQTSEEIYAKRLHQSTVSRELLSKAAIKKFRETAVITETKPRVRFKLLKAAPLFKR